MIKIEWFPYDHTGHSDAKANPCGERRGPPPDAPGRELRGSDCALGNYNRGIGKFTWTCHPRRGGDVLS